MRFDKCMFRYGGFEKVFQVFQILTGSGQSALLEPKTGDISRHLTWRWIIRKLGFHSPSRAGTLRFEISGSHCIVVFQCFVVRSPHLSVLSVNVSAFDNQFLDSPRVAESCCVMHRCLFIIIFR